MSLIKISDPSERYVMPKLDPQIDPAKRRLMRERGEYFPDLECRVDLVEDCVNPAVKYLKISVNFVEMSANAQECILDWDDTVSSILEYCLLTAADSEHVNYAQAVYLVLYFANTVQAAKHYERFISIVYRRSRVSCVRKQIVLSAVNKQYPEQVMVAYEMSLQQIMDIRAKRLPIT